MSLHRYAAKRDENERAIIDALVAVGCSVEQLDVIDLLVERAGKKFLLEVKSRKGKLTPRQAKFRRRFTFVVVRTPQEALAAVGMFDMRARAEVAAAKTHARIASILEANR
jgi:hypothetical protein